MIAARRIAQHDEIKSALTIDAVRALPDGLAKPQHDLLQPRIAGFPQELFKRSASGFALVVDRSAPPWRRPDHGGVAGFLRLGEM